MKVVTYIRVSTKDQEGNSPDSQRRVLVDYARGHKYSIAREFRETGSAYEPGRPEFRKMIQFLKSRRDVQGVLVYKIDRIARNLRDFVDLDDLEDVRLISATEALGDGASGHLMAVVQAGFARFFSEQLSERVKLGMETKVRKGVWTTNAPLGYLNDRETKGITPDPQKALLVVEMFEKYVGTSMSLRDLVEWANRRGFRGRTGKPLVKSVIHRMLSNQAYIGMIPWHGEILEGIHTSLISKALFRRAQDKLKGRGSPQARVEYPYRRLLVCGHCGCTLTASTAKKKYIYYRCTGGRGECPQSRIYIRQRDLGEILLPVVEGVHITRKRGMELLSLLADSKKAREDVAQRRVKSLQDEAAKIAAWREALYVDKVECKVTEERWMELDSKWRTQLDEIERDIALAKDSRKPERDNLERALELLERAPELYSRQGDEERARLLRVLVWNCRLSGRNPDPVYRKPFASVVDAKGSHSLYARRDSNPQPPVPKTGALSS